MPFLNFNSAKPGIKLTITIMSVITIGLILSFAGFLISRIIFHLDVPAANEILHHNTKFLSTTQIKYYSTISVLSFFIAPGIFLSWLFSTPDKSYISYRFPFKKIFFLIVPLFFIAAIPLFSYLQHYNTSLIFPPFMKDVEVFLNNLSTRLTDHNNKLLYAKTASGLFVNLFLTGLLPAIGAEIIFRGIIQKVFVSITRNNYMAIIFAAIIFGAAYGDFFAFIPRFALGILLGYLFLWGGSVWLPVYAHFIYNAIIIISFYLYENGFVKNDLYQWSVNLWGGKIVWASLFIIIAGLIEINKFSGSKKEVPE